MIGELISYDCIMLFITFYLNVLVFLIRKDKRKILYCENFIFLFLLFHVWAFYKLISFSYDLLFEDEVLFHTWVASILYELFLAIIVFLSCLGIIFEGVLMFQDKKEIFRFFHGINVLVILINLLLIYSWINISASC
jgi:hypothetical protein